MMNVTLKLCESMEGADVFFTAIAFPPFIVSACYSLDIAIVLIVALWLCAGARRGC
jgi:hypothetical protein